jgi:hypothetical protein
MNYLKGKAIHHPISSNHTSISSSDRLENGQKLNDDYIVGFCKDLDIDVGEVDEYTIPKFKISLTAINYALLISKAIYITREYEGYAGFYEPTKPF